MWVDEEDHDDDDDLIFTLHVLSEKEVLLIWSRLPETPWNFISLVCWVVAYVNSFDSFSFCIMLQNARGPVTEWSGLPVPRRISAAATAASTTAAFATDSSTVRAARTRTLISVYSTKRWVSRYININQSALQFKIQMYDNIRTVEAYVWVQLWAFCTI